MCDQAPKDRHGVISDSGDCDDDKTASRVDITQGRFGLGEHAAAGMDRKLSHVPDSIKYGKVLKATMSTKYPSARSTSCEHRKERYMTLVSTRLT